jgi:CheY-like chemotaxis protein
MADDSPQQRDRNAAVAIKFGMIILGNYDSGVDAVKYYPLLTPQVVILDIVMKNMTGVDAARAIRALSSSVKIVLITSMGQKAVSDPYLVGADYLLVKPFPDEWFLAAMLSLINQKQLVGGDDGRP